MKLTIALTSAFLLFLFIGSAQNIQFSEPENLSICHSDEFGITIRNNETSELRNVRLSLQLPCDIEYVPGSITGATEENIDDLSSPIFSLEDLTIDAIAELNMKMFAPCSVKTCIDNALVFFNEVELEHRDGTVNTTSEPYNVETPQLVITRIEDPVLDGFKGANLTRKVHIRNTRLGRLERFIYRDTSDEGLSLTANLGNNISQDPKVLELELDGNDFSQFGDGDEFLEFNEEIIIEENILVETCAYDLLTARSRIAAEWGCEQEICDGINQNALVDINIEFDMGEILRFETGHQHPTCYCKPDGDLQEITITNQGQISTAENIFLSIRENLPYGSIKANSIRVLVGSDIVAAKIELQQPGVLPCYPGLNSSNGFNVIIPELLPGQEARLLWDMLFCSEDSCFSSGNRWSYEWSYYKACALPDDSYFESEFSERAGSNKDLLKVDLIPPADQFDRYKLGGAIRDLEMEVTGDGIYELDGNLEISLTLPCDMSFNNTGFELENTLPNQIERDSVDSTLVLTLSYPLPFPRSGQRTLKIPTYYSPRFGCHTSFPAPKDSLVTSCEWDSICQFPPIGIGKGNSFDIVLDARIDQGTDCDPQCLVSDCDNQSYPLESPGLGIVFDTVPGYLDIDLSVERLSLGFADNNNDDLPEPGGMLDRSKIRTDRAITGDTIEAKMTGVVITDKPGSSFDHLLVQLSIELDTFFDIQYFGEESTGLDAQVLRLLDPESGIVLIDGKGYVKKQNGQIYEVVTIELYAEPEINFEEFKISYWFDLGVEAMSKLNPNLPTDLTYQEGDSILFVADFTIDHNFNTYNQRVGTWPQNERPESLQFLLNVKPVIAAREIEDLDEQFICECQSKSLTIANFYFSHNDNNGFFFPTCGTVANRSFPLRAIGYGTYSNFFPYECRDIFQLEKFHLPFIEGAFIPEFEIDLTVDGIEFYNEYILTNIDSVVISGNYSKGQVRGDYVILMDSLTNNIYGENHRLIVEANYHRLPECNWGPSRSTYSTPFFFKWYDNDERGVRSSFGLGGGRVEPRFDLFNCEMISFTNELIWEVELSNRLTRGPDHFDFPWLKLELDTNFIQDIKVYDIDQQTFIPQQNEIFQIKDRIGNREVVNLRITAVNNSCTEEVVVFRYGWNCEPFTDPNTEPCEEFKEICSAISPPGILDMLPEEMENEAALCDTMPYSEVQVFDAGLGAVYDLNISTQIPRGVSYVPGSAQMSWPAENQQYFSIPDPQEIGPNQYRWQLTDFIDTLKKNGLPGVNSVPDNTISIRYKTVTDCGFISGTKTIYTIEAQKICGEPTNSVAKVSERMKITGIDPDYQSFISTSFTGDPGCEDGITLELDVNFSSSLPDPGKLYLQIPAEIQYVNGSVITTLPDPNPTADGSYLVWTIPSGTDQASVEIDLDGFSQLTCKAVILPVFTTSTVNALCTETNTTCQIEVVTGDKDVALSVERPIFSFESFTVSPQPGADSLVNLTVGMINSGILNVDPIQLQFYLDRDGNGVLSPGDELLDTRSIDEFIDKDGMASIIVTDFKINPEDLCGLIVVASTDENCLCSPAERKLSGPFLYPAFQEHIICSGDSISIGKMPLPGREYRWDSPVPISCNNCDLTTVSIVNEGFEAMTYPLILKEIDPEGCVISYEFLITVPGQGRIWQADERVCQGEAAVLMASNAATYNWQGPGITNPQEQIQTIFPDQSAWYYVSVIDTFGCRKTDSVFVVVEEQPIADAGEDILACLGSQPQLTALQKNGYEYLWSPGSPYLSDPRIADPVVIQQGQEIFTLTVIKGNCVATDEVRVEFFDDYDMELPGDTVVCLSDTLSPVLPEGATYNWRPLFSGMCQDTNCREVILAPDQTTTFMVFGEREDGCRDTASFTVEIVEDGFSYESERTICTGGSTEIFGVLRSDAGVYCDTIEFASGCMYVQCVELKLEDKIETFAVENICEGDDYDFNGEVLSAAGRYCQDFITPFGCDSIHCIDLKIDPLPQLVVNMDTVTVEPGQGVTLDISSDAISYEWSPLAGLDCIDCPDPIASPEISTTYTVTAFSEMGCFVVDSIFVKVLDACEIGELLIPNAFTPDENGRNDIFRIVNLAESFPRAEISVYNRWGTRLFQENGNTGWDGTYLGEEQPPDVYLYLIIVECGDGNKQVFKGDLTLIR